MLKLRVRSHVVVQFVLMRYMEKPVFVCLNQHMLECDPLSNRVVLLIKATAKKNNYRSAIFMQARFHCHNAGEEK